jgi:hypothetical protein
LTCKKFLAGQAITACETSQKSRNATGAIRTRIAPKNYKNLILEIKIAANQNDGDDSRSISFRSEGLRPPKP